MPEARLARTRAAYVGVPLQFGNGRGDRRCRVGNIYGCDERPVAFPQVWRAPNENAAEQLARRARVLNAFDGEPRLHLSTLPDPDSWNVIEGEDH